MQASMPVKAYKQTERELTAFQAIKSIVYPEAQVTLKNTAADEGANVIYLYHEATQKAPVKVQHVQCVPTSCEQCCASCAYYHPFYSLIGNEARPEPEGRCIKHRVPGKHVKEKNVCEHYKP